jgi:hypothetical protein
VIRIKLKRILRVKIYKKMMRKIIIRKITSNKFKNISILSKRDNLIKTNSLINKSR